MRKSTTPYGIESTTGDDPFVTLYDLLWWQGIAPGVVATAVSRRGIFGWDRYGRYAYFSPKDPAHLATPLDVIADAYRQLVAAEFQADLDGVDEVALSNFGWPTSACPDLAAFVVEHAKQRQPMTAKPRDWNSTVRIVGLYQRRDLSGKAPGL